MAIASTASMVQRSEYVQETNNEFLALWPHRFDYIYAQHPDPNQKPDWQSEARHPLPDRLIEQGAFLYGVRFSQQTKYVMLDLDKGSPYHPARDQMALNRIIEALDPLGLVSHLAVISSDSKGLHIYFPFLVELPSWKISVAVAALLENAGFKVLAGWLEVFPNRKAYAPAGGDEISLYNGHRLPLQQGSYLLNDDLNPTGGSQATFARNWQTAAAHNDIDELLLEQTIKIACRKNYYVSGKAEKFLNDLNADIEPGWSGPGQTNFLLGRIAMRSYIFGHVLGAPAPLAGEELIADIIRVAIGLPGYADFCGHQHDIESRAKEWARSAESSHYFPYGSQKKIGIKNEGESWNDQQQQNARERIKKAVLEIFAENAWPDGITARFDMLCAAGISGSTLYKNRDLWHPEYMPAEAAFSFGEIPPNPPLSNEGAVGDSAEGASPTAYPPSLLGPSGCNAPDSKGYEPEKEIKSLPSDPPGCNKAEQIKPMSQSEGLNLIKGILGRLKFGTARGEGGLQEG